MQLNRIFLKIKLGILGVLLALLPQLAEATVAGRFQFVAGNVLVVSATGSARAAQKGGEIVQGDTIRTTTSSSAQIKMSDDGLIVVRPDTELKITTFLYTGKVDGSERSLISLFKGGFRAITGIIGHANKDNYKIQTPTATIGIRGTDHEPTFIPDPLPGQVSLIEPGTYDKVNSGAAVISNAKGIVVILPNQAGFVPNIPNVAPKVLAKVPTFFRAPDKNEPKVIPQEGAIKLNATDATKQQEGATPAQSTKQTVLGTPISGAAKTGLTAVLGETKGTTLVAPTKTTNVLVTTVLTPDQTLLDKTVVAKEVLTSPASVLPATVKPVLGTTSVLNKLPLGVIETVTPVVVAKPPVAINLPLGTSPDVVKPVLGIVPLPVKSPGVIVPPPVATLPVVVKPPISIAPPVGVTPLPIAPPVIKPITPPVIAPIAPPVIKPITPPVIAPIAPPVIKPITPPVIAPIAPPVIKPITPPVIAPIAPPVIKPITPPVIAPIVPPVIKPITPPVIAPIAPPVIKPIVPPVIAPIAPPVIQPIIPPVIAPIAPPVIQPIIPPVIAPIAPPVIQPIIPPVIAPITPPVIQPIVPPVIAPIAPPVIKPITPPVIAPITPPVISPLPIVKPIAISDRRLKKNIKRIGTHPLGIGLYEFDYLWGQHAIGVMADEVKSVRPEAVLHHPDGYDMVDYSKLN